MSSERAGTPTHGALNREKARDVVAVRTGHIPTEQMLDALGACVVPDTRIARIEALVAEADEPQALAKRLLLVDAVRAALRGDQ